ncbi:uncharacterized protein LOC144121530 [Amblyomma americanum]
MEGAPDASDVRPVDPAITRRPQKVRFTLPDGTVVSPQKMELVQAAGQAQLGSVALGGKRAAQEDDCHFSVLGVKPQAVIRGSFPMRSFKRRRSIDAAPTVLDAGSDASLAAGDASSGAVQPPTGSCCCSEESGATQCPQSPADGVFDEILPVAEGRC